MVKQNKRPKQFVQEEGISSLYITGFNPEKVTRQLIHELFAQGGPVRKVTVKSNYAFVDFDDPESASYCLALFSDIELHGDRLQIRPNSKCNYKYVDHLRDVRCKLRDIYRNLPIPKLPSPRRPNSTRFESRNGRRNEIKSPKDKFNDSKNHVIETDDRHNKKYKPQHKSPRRNGTSRSNSTANKKDYIRKAQKSNELVINSIKTQTKKRKVVAKKQTRTSDKFNKRLNNEGNKNNKSTKNFKTVRHGRR